MLSLKETPLVVKTSLILDVALCIFKADKISSPTVIKQEKEIVMSFQISLGINFGLTGPKISQP